MRMTASWFRSPGIYRIQGRGARSLRLTLGRLASDRLAFCSLLGKRPVGRLLIPTRPSLPPCSRRSRNGLEMMCVVNDLADGHP